MLSWIVVQWPQNLIDCVFFSKFQGKKMPSGETNIQGSELTFYRVSRHHAGVYECVAKNKLGAARTAVSLVVTRKWFLCWLFT